MRTGKMNGLGKEITSSFLSCEKDTETIIEKLFVNSRPYSDDLKRLLVIGTEDCLDNKTNQVYLNKLKEMTLKKLRDERYICIEPKIEIKENEEIKSRIVIFFDNFVPNKTNPYYRDCILYIFIISPSDLWDIGNYRLRPIKMAGIIDGILNGASLSGIGTLNFLGCNEVILEHDLSGYLLMYEAIHGVDDILEPDDEE